MAFGINFDNCVSLHAPVPVLLVSLGMNVELGQKGLYIVLVLDGQNTSLEVLSEGHIIIAVSLTWWLSASSAA